MNIKEPHITTLFVFMLAIISSINIEATSTPPGAPSVSSITVGLTLLPSQFFRPVCFLTSNDVTVCDFRSINNATCTVKWRINGLMESASVVFNPGVLKMPYYDYAAMTTLRYSSSFARVSCVVMKGDSIVTSRTISTVGTAPVTDASAVSITTIPEADGIMTVISVVHLDQVLVRDVEWSISDDVIEDTERRYVNTTMNVASLGGEYYSIVTFKPSNSTQDKGDLKCTVFGNNGESWASEVSNFDPDNIKYGDCPEINEGGILLWPRTRSYGTASYPCSEGLEGFITRQCVESEWLTEENLCYLFAKSPHEDQSNVNSLYLVNMTIVELDTPQLNRSVDLLENVTANYERNPQWNVTMETIKNLVTVGDRLLDPRNHESWEELTTDDDSSAESILESMERVAHLVPRASDVEGNFTTGGHSVELEAVALPLFGPSTDMTFPSPREKWDGNQVLVPAATITDLRNEHPNAPMVTALHMKTVGNYLPKIDERTLDSSVLIVVAGDFNTDAVQNGSIRQQQNLTTPIRLLFNIEDKDISVNNATCLYYNLQETSRGWSADGVLLHNISTSSVYCVTYHLSSFGSLFSHSGSPRALALNSTHYDILSKLTTVGCSISVAAMTITLIVYFIIWRHIKAQTTIVTVNLCIALIVANIFFLIGFDERGDTNSSISIFCEATTMLLHYTYTVSFALMGAQGVLLYLYVVKVFYFPVKNETLFIVLSSWGIPAVIVGVTIGVASLDDYVASDICWLSARNYVRWAFIGPALAVLAMNLIILLLSMRALCTRARSTLDSSRIKDNLWNMMVLAPILGLTWLFGALIVDDNYVNSDDWNLVCHYLFTVSNAFQGLFIMLFHCILNKKVRHRLREVITSSGHSPTGIRKFSSKKKSHPDESSSSGEATMDIGNTLDSGATLDTTDGLDNNQNTVSRDDEEYNY